MAAAPLHSGPPLRSWLAGEGGAVPFSRFMEAALYDLEFGYYASQIRTVGAQGDFSTSATLSPRLAAAIAGWIGQEGEKDRGLRHVIEIGPGNGVLHRDLRRCLGWQGRRRWTSHLVERSPALRKVQRNTLGWWGRRGVSWHGDPAAALQAADGAALIFSNELVDAFPVMLLQKHQNVWHEVWLELAASGRPAETLRPVSSLEILTLFSAARHPEAFPEGQRIEGHASCRSWLEAWRPAWKRGAMLTIDYGSRLEDLYYRRPGGTLRGYRNHRRLEGLDIYGNLGSCDLTADVNFTDLENWGVGLGLKTTSLESQATFLERFHPSRQGKRDQDEAGTRLADEAGAGGAFQCLVQVPAATER